MSLKEISLQNYSKDLVTSSMSQRRRVQPNGPKKGVPETWDGGMECWKFPTAKYNMPVGIRGAIPGFVRSDRHKFDQ